MNKKPQQLLDMSVFKIFTPNDSCLHLQAEKKGSVLQWKLQLNLMEKSMSPVNVHYVEYSGML